MGSWESVIHGRAFGKAGFRWTCANILLFYGFPHGHKPGSGSRRGTGVRWDIPGVILVIPGKVRISVPDV